MIPPRIATLLLMLSVQLFFSASLQAGKKVTVDVSATIQKGKKAPPGWEQNIFSQSAPQLFEQSPQKGESAALESAQQQAQTYLDELTALKERLKKIEKKYRACYASSKTEKEIKTTTQEIILKEEEPSFIQPMVSQKKEETAIDETPTVVIPETKEEEDFAEKLLKESTSEENKKEFDEILEKRSQQIEEKRSVEPIVEEAENNTPARDINKENRQLLKKMRKSRNDGILK